MENNPKIEFSETNRGREQLIINKKYKFNFLYKRKDNTRVYRCSEYKGRNKCIASIILDDKKRILKYTGLHNHLEKEFEASKSLLKHEIRKEIRKSKNPSCIKPKKLFDKYSKKIGFICPEYNTIKSQIRRSIKKQLPPEITTFEDIPDNSEYYENERNEKFMIYKDLNMIIFQSPFQAELFANYNEDMFADGTFFIAPRFSYQVFVTRTYVPKFNSFYTTSFSILNNKKQETYEVLFKEIKKNVKKIFKGIEINPKNIHCDFEGGVSGAAKKVFPNIKIKYCIWHFKRSLEIQKNKYCYKEIEDNNILYTYYKIISNLPFINQKYIFYIFFKIQNECFKNNYENFLIFLDYFLKTYIFRYDMPHWDYHDNIKHLTNNASESYNSLMNKLFSEKPTILNLILSLKNLESTSYYDYLRRYNGIWGEKKRTLSKTDKISKIIKKYKNKELILIKNGSIKEIIGELWYNCLIELIKIDF